MASNSRNLICGVSMSMALTMCCMILTRQPVDAAADKFCSRDNNQAPRGICGTYLANLVSMVCKPLGGVNKRDAEYLDEILSSDGTNADSDMDKAISANGLSGEPSSSIFLPKTMALSYLRSQRSIGDESGIDRRSGHSIQRRSIVCECCVHQCNFSELRMYCQRPFATYDPHHGKRSALRQPASSVLIPQSSSVGPDDQQQAISNFHGFGSVLSATLFKSSDKGGFDDTD